MDIILYVLDSLRADHLSCYGYERKTSPNIESLAKDGVLFENAFAQTSWTRPSAASILTSTYPSANGLIHRSDFFPSHLTTLPELLKEKGYQTLGISAIGNVSSTIGFDKGFDEFIDLYKSEDLYKKREITSTDKERLDNEDVDKIVLPIAEDINNVLFPWIEDHSKEDKFIFIWSIDTHDPFNPPDGFDKFCDPGYNGKINGSRDSIKRARSNEDVQRLIDLYDSEIFYNDFYIGRLLDFLKNKGYYDESFLIITSDHGEAFHDHGNNVGHGYIPYRELVHVPLILKFQIQKPSQKRVSAFVQLIDLMPTILENIGFSKSIMPPLQGRSLMPTLNGNLINDYIYSETNPTEIHANYFSVRNDKWNYILIEPPQLSFRDLFRNYLKIFSNPVFIKEVLFNPTYYIRKKLESKNEMLFNIVEDYDEKNNVKKQFPEVARRFREELTQWRETNKEFSKKYIAHPVENLEIDSETIRNLRELGYID
jgi:arylsulfatase A-like enzyme